MPPPPGSPEGRAIQQIQAEYFAGPIPSPSLLAKYNEVIPNGAERILAMAERQSAHRESLEAQVVAGNLAIQAQGSVFAFVIALVTILGGIFLIYAGKDIFGFAAIIASLVGLASVFVYSKRGQQKERVKKADALESRKHS